MQAWCTVVAGYTYTCILYLSRDLSLFQRPGSGASCGEGESYSSFHSSPKSSIHNNYNIMYIVIHRCTTHRYSEAQLFFTYYAKVIHTCNTPLNQPLILGRSDALTISPQDFSLSQWGNGLEWGFSSATPPVNRNRHTCSSTSPLQLMLYQYHASCVHNKVN